MIEINGVCYAENPLPPLPRVVSVRPLPGYRLEVGFADGARRLFDVAPLLGLAAFAPLSDRGFFGRARVERHTVVWSDEIDIDPEMLFDRGEPIER